MRKTEPTPAQVGQRARRIRESWPPAERDKRAGLHPSDMWRPGTPRTSRLCKDYTAGAATARTDIRFHGGVRD